MDRAADERMVRRSAADIQAVVADRQVVAARIRDALAVGRQVAVVGSAQVEVVGSVRGEVVDT